MTEQADIKTLLEDIRDNQRRALDQQSEHLALAREQVERARKQVEESIELQKVALTRVKQVSRIVLPAIVILIGLLIYLLVRFF